MKTLTLHGRNLPQCNQPIIIAITPGDPRWFDTPKERLRLDMRNDAKAGRKLAKLISQHVSVSLWDGLYYAMKEIHDRC